MTKPRKNVVVFIIHPSGNLVKSTQPKNPELKQIQDAVGGYIERVPHFTHFEHEGVKYTRGTAWCNEEGRINGLPYNDRATQAWLECLGKGPFRYNPVLNGSVMFHAKEVL